jgi:3-methyladenine DNA glycosylase AlkD
MDRTAACLDEALRAVARPGDAEFLQRFFKTGPGDYGDGDVFIGVRVPATRAVIKGFRGMPQSEVEILLDSAVHEHRLAGLLLMVDAFTRAGTPKNRDEVERRRLHEDYLAAVHRGRVNNWDLVDSSAEYLVGGFVREDGGDGSVIDALAADEDLWRRRVGILSTFAWIKAAEAGPALRICAVVRHDRRDLIQKASGWMLREVGKRVDRTLLVDYLEGNAASMGATALSYATEHLATPEREHFRALRRAGDDAR